jgi:uncharacterized protein (TIGR02594 family)
MTFTDYVLSKYIGLQEKPGVESSPTILRWIKKYFPATMNDADIAYCSIGLIETAKEFGIKIPETINPLAKSWLQLKKTFNPVIGNIVVFKRGPINGHVAIFLREDIYGYIWHLGFNQSNSCGITKTHKSLVLGYVEFPN